MYGLVNFQTQQSRGLAFVGDITSLVSIQTVQCVMYITFWLMHDYKCQSHLDAHFS